ncbi:MAG: HAD family hydrolase [Geothrix sp.]|nr:HAD family hydrolase [Geothrix sp.]
MGGFHLVTDLDGTWLAGSPSARQGLEAVLAARQGIVLTFATGRTFTSALEAIAHWDLHPPDHLITDVGAALFHRDSTGNWVENQVWARRATSAWNASAAAGVLAAGLPGTLRPQPDLVPLRRLAFQASGPAELAAAEPGLAETCRLQGLVADLLPSHGIYLDVLPHGIHKGSALAYLQAACRLPRPIVGCGDSTNDLALFEAADLPLLMQDGLPDREIPAPLRDRIHRTKAPGPEGIHLALAAFGLLEGASHGR